MFKKTLSRGYQLNYQMRTSLNLLMRDYPELSYRQHTVPTYSEITRTAGRPFSSQTDSIHDDEGGVLEDTNTISNKVSDSF